MHAQCRDCDLHSCGTAPDLVYWWLDRYIDFNDTQTPRVHEAIKQWFAWHRRSQLPDYAAFDQFIAEKEFIIAYPEGPIQWESTRCSFSSSTPTSAA